MPGVTLPPDQGRTLVGTAQRIERVERQTVVPGASSWLQKGVTFPGGLTSNVESPPWYPLRPGAIRVVRLSLLANATTDHTVQTRVNGTGIQNFTLPTGSKTILFATAIQVPGESYVTMFTVAVTDSDLSMDLAFG